MAAVVALSLDVLEKERTRLLGELAILDRQWRRKHYLAVFIVLAIPAGFFGGRMWAGAFMLMTPALVLTQAYLLAVRRNEALGLLAEVNQELAERRAESP